MREGVGELVGVVVVLIYKCRVDGAPRGGADGALPVSHTCQLYCDVKDSTEMIQHNGAK